MKRQKNWTPEDSQYAPGRPIALTYIGQSLKRIRNPSILNFPAARTMITRSMAARMALYPKVELPIPFAIDSLPPELKDMTFQMLPVEDLKSVRVVCKNWHSFASRYVGIKNPTLCDSTFETLTRTEEKFQEMTIQTLLSSKSMRSPPATFLPGEKIRKITFDRAVSFIEKLEWVFAACPNVEEIQIFEFDRPYHIPLPEDSPLIFSSPWLQLVSVCGNLKSLKIDILPREDRIANLDLFRHIGFDCEPLARCTKLQEFKIVGLAPFYIKNCEKLPSSLRDLSFLLLLEMFETMEHFDQFYESVCTQYKILPSIMAHVPSDEDSFHIRRFFTIMRLFPELTPIRIVANSPNMVLACADVLREIVGVIKRHEKHTRIVSSILSFNQKTTTEVTATATN